jgi:hypothetical protein
MIDKILSELARAKTIWPKWPDDPIHAAAVIAEEAGEIVKAALDFTYSSGPLADMEAEAIQTAAMCIRFLENLNMYKKVDTLK